MSVKSIEKILKTGKQVYMFMHDMWAITGGCHHSLNCNMYKTFCLSCPHTNNGHGTKLKKDLSFLQFRSKLHHLSSYGNLRFITPSRWLAERVKESALFANHKVDVVRNVLNTDIFKPLNRYESRNFFGLPKDKILILFGADHIANPYKGWNLLRDALKSFDQEFEVVIYGKCFEDIQSQVGVICHTMGKINDTEKLIRLYSACDVFITSSIAENYPNVLIEAMACGLPCIGTNIGGIPEIIQNGETGLIIPDLSSQAVRNTIKRFINLSSEKIEKMRKEAINSVRENNSYQIMVWRKLLSD